MRVLKALPASVLALVVVLLAGVVACGVLGVGSLRLQHRIDDGTGVDVVPGTVAFTKGSAHGRRSADPLSNTWTFTGAPFGDAPGETTLQVDDGSDQRALLDSPAALGSRDHRVDGLFRGDDLVALRLPSGRVVVDHGHGTQRAAAWFLLALLVLLLDGVLVGGVLLVVASGGATALADRTRRRGAGRRGAPRLRTLAAVWLVLGTFAATAMTFFGERWLLAVALAHGAAAVLCVAAWVSLWREGRRSPSAAPA